MNFWKSYTSVHMAKYRYQVICLGTINNKKKNSQKSGSSFPIYFFKFTFPSILAFVKEILV